MLTFSFHSITEEAEALVNVLHERVQNLVEETNKSISNEIYDIGNFRVLGVCRVLEEIFQHGMKQPDLGVVFWAYVRVNISSQQLCDY